MKRLLPVAILAAAVAALPAWAAVNRGSQTSATTIHVVEHADTDAVSNGRKAEQPVGSDAQ